MSNPAINPIIGNDGISDDTLRGASSVDRIIGKGGNDILQGLGGNDTLLGGRGNDTLVGGAGDDLLNAAGDLQGVGEFDRIISGPGADTIVLGNVNAAFYVGNGSDDLAFISDFDTSNDTLRLFGSESDYTFGVFNANASTLLYDGDVIAVFSGVTDTAAIESTFDFI